MTIDGMQGEEVDPIEQAARVILGETAKTRIAFLKLADRVQVAEQERDDYKMALAQEQAFCDSGVWQRRLVAAETERDEAVMFIARATVHGPNCAWRRWPSKECDCGLVPWQERARSIRDMPRGSDG